MAGKRWFRFYLLFAGSTILTLGLILAFRSMFNHHSYMGVILGAALIVYGIMRLRQYSAKGTL